MKNKLLLFLLFVCFNGFGQSVPNTNTFLFSDICNAVYGSYSAGMTLTGAFTDSDPDKFDSDYGSKAMNPQLFLGFRNYGGTSLDYGKLYNYSAAATPTITAAGWHVPSNTEWTTLSTYVGGESVAGGALKETGTTHWLTPNTGAVNSFGFTARAGGYRYVDGVYWDVTKYGRWWSSTAYGEPGTAWGRGMDWNSDNLEKQYWLQEHGFSIRLVNDAACAVNGVTGTYTGNDSQVYTTICIGTQEWMSENLKETKYRNGTDIPVVLGNAEWAVLYTPGKCGYILP